MISGSTSRKLRSAAKKAVVRLGLRDPDFDTEDFRTSVEPEARSEIERIMYSGQCRRLHKWTHYPPAYERLFSQYRASEVRFLEIGVFGGGSLDLWRCYLGPSATIHGVDINPDCASLSTIDTPVHIGSQADKEFMRGVVAEMGGLDVVLDDGSHVGRHQHTSFEVLWPLLSDGGLYVIEDVHTSYWPAFGGGYRKQGSAIGLAKQIIDDMHAWYHDRATSTSAKHEVGSVQVFDSIIAIEKQHRERPAHIVIERRDDQSAGG